MDTKDLLKQALDSQIAGDADTFAAMMKQVVTAKTSKLVSELSNEPSDGPQPDSQGVEQQ